MFLHFKNQNILLQSQCMHALCMCHIWLAKNLALYLLNNNNIQIVTYHINDMYHPHICRLLLQLFKFKRINLDNNQLCTPVDT